MIRSVSPKPRVVSSPTREPPRVTTALIATVVPCASRSVWLSSAERSIPSSAAATSIAAKNPRCGSSGVVGALATVIVPASSTTAQSVKVPPMSTPIR
jgi:hypothetical protein